VSAAQPGLRRRGGPAALATLDLGTVRAVLEADSPRVICREHGVVVASVPWARHDAGHTHAFDEQVAAYYVDFNVGDQEVGPACGLSAGAQQEVRDVRGGKLIASVQDADGNGIGFIRST